MDTQKHNVQGVRTDLEDDFWKALSKYKEVASKKHQRSVRRCQKIPEEVKHEKLAKLRYWRSALNSNIVLTV